MAKDDVHCQYSWMALTSYLIVKNITCRPGVAYQHSRCGLDFYRGVSMAGLETSFWRGKAVQDGSWGIGELEAGSGEDRDLFLTYHISTACSGTYPQGKPPLTSQPKFISTSPALASSPWQGPTSQTCPKHFCFQPDPAEQPKWLHQQTNHRSHWCLGHQSPNLALNPTNWQHGPAAPQRPQTRAMEGGFSQEMTLMEAMLLFAHTRMDAVQHLSSSFSCVWEQFWS